MTEFLILAMVLILPFSVRWVEEELEFFLLAMGCSAVTAAGLWSASLIKEALTEPLEISAAVLFFGFLFRWSRDYIRKHVVLIANRIGIRTFLFLLVAGLAFLSSLITAIVAALVLVEVISALSLKRDKEIAIVILACYAIGLGAVLTPLGEPLSAITTAKLAGPPHHADFFFLARLLGPWVAAGVALMSLLAARSAGPAASAQDSLASKEEESLPTLALRAAKVYLFVAALVLLGRGFSPLVDRYVIGLPRAVLYWINIASAALDNATLAAAEISPKMSLSQIKFLLLGLVLSGGMMIPGNIPNIICAKQLKITSREWARFAAPFGIVIMTGYFILLQFMA